MSEIGVEGVPLAAGERVYKTVPVVEGQNLVSDGNSRWVEHDGLLYLVVNESYSDPEAA